LDRQVVIRADAGPTLGLGHVIRCISLAQALHDRGHKITFISIKSLSESIPVAEYPEFDFLEFEQSHADEPGELKQRWPGGVDLLVVDSYFLDREFEDKCRGWSRKILVIDDLANRPHNCDYLLDMAPSRRPENYENLVSPDCVYLLGTDYALLRPEFAKLRQAATEHRMQPGPLKRILVNFGGTDDNNTTPLALMAIAKSRLEVEVDIMVGSGATNLQKIKDAIKEFYPQAILHLDVRNPAPLMASADIAIGAGGGTMWERCCLGLPTIVVQSSPDQSLNYSVIADMQAMWPAGQHETISVESLADQLCLLSQNANEVQKVSQTAASICDGRGARRVAQRVSAPIARDQKQISIQPVTMLDGEIILQWQSDPQIRQYARHNEAPTETEHRDWMLNRTSDPNCLLNMIFHGLDPAGIVRLDKMKSDIADNCFEISIFVCREKQKLGLGQAALDLAHDLVPECTMIAEILKGNEVSRNLFGRAGYKENSHGTFVHQPLRLANLELQTCCESRSRNQ
jgi:UDP-2,4-diacetamido-2,4,6-trideoxy-beta-L-altropyranose hydrolase